MSSDSDEGCKKFFRVTSLMSNNNTRDNSFKNDVISSNEHRFSCSVCSFEASSNKEFCSHCKLNKHYITCEKCEKKFISEASFKKHLNSHCFEKRYECSACSYRTSQKEMFIKHFTFCSEVPAAWCEECSETFSEKKYLIRHLRVHEGKDLLECNFCHAGFKYKTSLIRHTRIHKASQSLTCSKCLYEAVSKDDLQLHRQQVHNFHGKFDFYNIKLIIEDYDDEDDRMEKLKSEDEYYKCKSCHKTLESKDDLDTHYLNDHPELNPLNCPLCSYICFDNKELKLHYKTHKAEEFPCDVCLFRARSKTALRNHMKAVHSKKFKLQEKDERIYVYAENEPEGLCDCVIIEIKEGKTT